VVAGPAERARAAPRRPPQKSHVLVAGFHLQRLIPRNLRAKVQTKIDRCGQCQEQQAQ